jgi:hypothetical protein
MENIRSYRAMSISCRQQAALHPAERSNWLRRAELWEQMIEAELKAHFKACNMHWSNCDLTAA